VLSHPFARKKAKGWGTELIPIHAVKKPDAGEGAERRGSEYGFRGSALDDLNGRETARRCLSQYHVSPITDRHLLQAVFFSFRMKLEKNSPK
jgi:hypothetical protein